MFKYTHDNGEQSIEFEGKLIDLLTECAFIVKTVYNEIKKKDAAQAEAFKSLVIKVIGDEKSPVWVDRSLRDILIDKLDMFLSDFERAKE